MIDTLLLLSGNDIPFEEAQLVIHPPTLKEIGYIGENNFWNGIEFLNFSRDLLSDEDKNNLSSKTDFEILLIVIQSQNVAIRLNRTQMELVLTLLFPEYYINFTSSAIIFQKEKEKPPLINNNDTFFLLKENLSSIFCLDLLLNQGRTQNYNPANKAAEMLVKKFKNRRKKLAEIKKDKSNGGGDILSNYASILAVGTGQDLNTIMNYTVFQLIDEFKRYQLKMEFDTNIQARMAGAKGLKDAENWMKNIHNNNDMDI